MHFRHLSPAFLFVVIAFSVHGQGVYKFVGPDGRTSYSDKPPASATSKYDVLRTSPQSPTQNIPSASSGPASSPDSNTTYATSPRDAKKAITGEKSSGDPPPIRTASSESPQLTGQDEAWSKLRRESTSRYMQRDFAGAFAAEKQAMAIAERASPTDPRISKSLHAMATMSRLQGNNVQAISFYHRLIASSDRGPEYPQIGAVLRDLADAYRIEGRVADAKKFEDRAAAIGR